MPPKRSRSVKSKKAVDVPPVTSSVPPPVTSSVPSVPPVPPKRVQPKRKVKPKKTLAESVPTPAEKETHERKRREYAEARRPDERKTTDAITITPADRAEQYQDDYEVGYMTRKAKKC